MFKLFAIVMLLAVLLPAAVSAQNPGIKQGDPAFYFDFPGGTISILRGESWCFTAYACNYGWSSATCPDWYDTFAVVSSDLHGWPITNTFISFDQGIEGEDAEGKCYIINDDGIELWYFVTEICFSVPCDATGGLNTLTLQMVYCDGTMTAQPDSGDCEDPNMHMDIPRWSTITQDFDVVESPPALLIFQDTLYYVEDGQAAAYIPFSICNGDPCSTPADFDYVITNSFTGIPSETIGTVEGLAGGNCEDVYAKVNATLYNICDFDTLTIIAWDAETGTRYDTCVQAIHIIEGLHGVPVMGRASVIVLVAALIAATALIIRRRTI